MSILDYLLIGWGGLSAVAISTIAVLLMHRAQHVRHLSTVPFHPPEVWPSVSVVVPACNEEDHIEAALQSLLRSDYPDVEFVVVNDRSSDDTGRIIDRLAAEDDRVRPIHIETLSDGWLGKVHALQRGYEEASGEWILMTDADIEYAPDALRRTVAFAVENEADHLACIPQFRTSGFWHEVLALSYISGVQLGLDTAKVEDPKADDYMGVGAFNLVHRSMLESGAGLEPIRMELADDVGLGWIVQQQGGRTLLSFADDTLEFDWYESTGEAIRGLEKNVFPLLSRFNFVVGLIKATIPALVFLGLVACFLSPLPPIRWFGIGALGILVLSHARAATLFHRPITTAFFAPVGALMVMYAIFRSAFICWQKGGVEWRGTTYSLDELEQGQVVEF